MTGWAPTQGHIPSGVPYLGPLVRECLEGTTRRAMIIGKGSLFLGRMTNLFDGVSFVVQANEKAAEREKQAVEDEAVGNAAVGAATAQASRTVLSRGACPGIKIVFALEGSEHGAGDGTGAAAGRLPRA